MLRGVQLFEVSTKPLSTNYAGDGFMVMTPSVLIYGAKMKKILLPFVWLWHRAHHSHGPQAISMAALVYIFKQCRFREAKQI